MVFLMIKVNERSEPKKGGFATRKLEQEYNIVLEQTISALSSFILKEIKGLKQEVVGSLAKIIDRLHTTLIAFENHKYLEPKFSFTLDPLAQELNAFLKQNPTVYLSTQENIGRFDSERKMPKSGKCSEKSSPRGGNSEVKKENAHHHQNLSQSSLSHYSNDHTFEFERVELKTITNRFKIDTPTHYRTFCVTARAIPKQKPRANSIQAYAQDGDIRSCLIKNGSTLLTEYQISDQEDSSASNTRAQSQASPENPKQGQGILERLEDDCCKEITLASLVKRKYQYVSETINQCTEESEDGGQTSRRQTNKLGFKEEIKSISESNQQQPTEEAARFKTINLEKSNEPKKVNLPRLPLVLSQGDSAGLYALNNKTKFNQLLIKKRRSLSLANEAANMEDVYDPSRKTQNSQNGDVDKLRFLREINLNAKNITSHTPTMRSVSPSDDISFGIMKTCKAAPTFKPLTKILKGTKQEVFQSLKEEMKSHEKYLNIDLNQKVFSFQEDPQIRRLKLKNINSNSINKVD